MRCRTRSSSRRGGPTSTPTHVEVYLPEQVVAIFEDNVPVMISHASSGSNEEWCEEVTISPGEFGNETRHRAAQAR